MPKEILVSIAINVPLIKISKIFMQTAKKMIPNAILWRKIAGNSLCICTKINAQEEPMSAHWKNAFKEENQSSVVIQELCTSFYSKCSTSDVKICKNQPLVLILAWFLTKTYYWRNIHRERRWHMKRRETEGWHWIEDKHFIPETPTNSINGLPLLEGFDWLH